MIDARRGPQLAFVLLVAAAYGGAIFYTGGLSFEPVKDEEQFWLQVMSFAKNWPPSLEQLRNYQEPMTPVSFLVWAQLESWHELGIAAARLANLAAALTVLALIGLRNPAPGAQQATPALAALALLAYPYWLPMSLLIYTDVPATLFVVLGVLLYIREKHIASAALFFLAIGTRQYMVAFPVAIVVYEGLDALRTRNPAWSRWLPCFVAAASLLAWIAFFGGIGPADGLAKWPRHANALARITPAFSLYFLAAIGAYFVVPEFAIDRRWQNFEFRLGRRVVLALVALTLCFLIFTPNYPHEIGPLNRTLSYVLGENAFASIVRPAVLLLLACATIVRFSRLDLSTWLVAVNAALMAFLWSPWEKYCMPVLAALWILKSTGALDRPERSPHSI